MKKADILIISGAFISFLHEENHQQSFISIWSEKKCKNELAEKAGNYDKI